MRQPSATTTTTGAAAAASVLNDDVLSVSKAFSETDLTDTDRCPRCKLDRVLQPTLKLMVSMCGHRFCEKCVSMMIRVTPIVCPTCSTQLRPSSFVPQQFESMKVQMEIPIRKRILGIYNSTEEDFQTLDEYNAYLEMVEDIIYNLSNDIDVASTQACVEEYKQKHIQDIITSAARREQAELMAVAEIEEIEREEALRREERAAAELEAAMEVVQSHENVLNMLANTNKNASDVVAEAERRLQRKQRLATEGIRKSTVKQLDNVTFSRHNAACINTYVYKAPSFVRYGPALPAEEELQRAGYMRHMPEDVESIAGGFRNIDVVHRAIDEAFSSLWI